MQNSGEFSYNMQNVAMHMEILYRHYSRSYSNMNAN